MIDKAISVAITVILAIVAVWFFDSKIRAYYQAPLIAQYEETIKLQKKQNELAASKFKAQKEATKTVYIDRIKEINTYAATLPIDSACRATPEFIRLFNNR